MDKAVGPQRLEQGARHRWRRGDPRDHRRSPATGWRRCGDERGARWGCRGGVCSKLPRRRLGAIWDALHPAEQELISRDEFVQCHQSQGATAGLVSQEVTEIHTGDPVASGPGEVIGATGPSGPVYPGIDEQTMTIVTVRTEVKTPDGPETVRRRVLMVPTDSGYKLIFSPKDQLAFEAGQCPSPRTA